MHKFLAIVVLFFSSSIASDSVESAQTAAAETVSEAFRQIPYFADGQVVGYRVYPGPNQDLFYALGFNLGDLVSEFNGRPITELDLFLEFLDLLGDGEIVRVTVGELGDSETLEVQFLQSSK